MLKSCVRSKNGVCFDVSLRVGSAYSDIRAVIPSIFYFGPALAATAAGLMYLYKLLFYRVFREHVLCICSVPSVCEKIVTNNRGQGKANK